MRTSFYSLIILFLWMSVAPSAAQKWSQSISFEKIPAATFGDNALPLVASSSSGLPVSFKSSNPRVALVASDSVQIVGAGRALITAMQAGDSGFRAAKSVSRPLLVAKKSQSIDFLPLGEVSIATGEVQLSAVASSGLPVSFASSNPRVASVRGNTLKPLRAGQIKITARQAGNANFKAALPIRRTITVTAAPTPTPTPTPAPTPTPTPTPTPSPPPLPLENSAPVASGSATLAAVPGGAKDYVLQGERVGNLFFKNFSDAADASRTNDLFVTRKRWDRSFDKDSQKANEFAFAALKTDGSVVTWGDAESGGDSSIPIWDRSLLTYRYSSVADQLAGGVVEIFSSSYSYAALKADGSVVPWGPYPIITGDIDGDVKSQLTGGVVEIFSSRRGLAALKTDGSVVTWGVGSSRGVSNRLTSAVAGIFSTDEEYAALKMDGSVVTWPDESPDYTDTNTGSAKIISVGNQLTNGVEKIYSTALAFAALKTDGSVVTWGNRSSGGDPEFDDAFDDPSAGERVRNQLSSGVVEIFSTRSAFAALKTNGSVVTWGLDGGRSSYFSNQLSSGVVRIFATDLAFAALKTNGSVVTWGRVDGIAGSGTVSNQLSSGVVEIFTTRSAFAALKTNGSVVTWGSRVDGGNSSIAITKESGLGYTFTSISNQLAGGVVEMFSNLGAFAALKTNGSVVTWGLDIYGGDRSICAYDPSKTNYVFTSVADKLTNGVVTLATPSRKSRLVPGNALAGVAVTANTASSLQGKWQFSTNGFHWADVPANLSPGAALVLQNDTQLRFAPAPSFVGAPGGLTVQLIETGGAPLVSGLITNAAAASGGANRISIDSVQLNTLVR